MLVAGVGLVILGVIVASFPRGAILGTVSITVGVVLAVHAAIKLAAEVGGRAKRSPRVLGADDPLTVPDPGISFWRWLNDVGWGTTPWAVSARLFVIAMLTGAWTFAYDMPAVDLDLWMDIAVRALMIFGLLTALFLPAWIIERLTAPRRLLPRSADLAFIAPAGAGTIVAGLLVAAGSDPIWAAIIAGAQLILAVIAGVVLTRLSHRGD
ncbi:hypothetical protein [Microbacterium sp. SLBN-146]|uniref:hypothetical protein n=1 Tax=Microbacterium sp. SLBN-146 TaxID=2768457 RepID=UPI00115496C9|nr:hypothetical protein [Microbacterium sp. SLBN-146]